MAELIAISFFAFCGGVLSYKPISEHQKRKKQRIQESKRHNALESEACRLLIEEYDVIDAINSIPKHCTIEEWDAIVQKIYCLEN